ncbi:MAG: CHRD domain-containing protein [Pseudomonadota bacterium]
MVFSRRASLASLALAAAAALAGITGCASMKSSTVTLGATLNGASEVPANTSTGSGTAQVWLNKDTNLLKWKVEYSGLSGPATAAHFHGPAEPGKNTAPVVPFKPPVTSPIEGEATLTAAQAADLLAGKWYVNVHTAKAPGGEIRGQVMPR